MKFLLPVEKAAHRLRDNMFSYLRTFDWFRLVSLWTIRDDIILITKQFDDHRLTFSPHETIGRSLFHKGQFQRDLALRVLDLIGDQSGKILLELGANIGTHSVYLMRAGGFERAICIEPEPHNVVLLKHNLLQNDLTETTTVVECAVGDREGVAELYLHRGNSGGASLFNGDGHPSIKVPLRRVDSILTENNVPSNSVGLVWMDIEGAEPDALRSMTDLVEHRVPILMEYMPSRVEPAKTKEMIDRLSDHYGRCIVFSRKKIEREMDIHCLPDDGSHDILLLP